MKLSSLNIWSRYRDRRRQQEREVRESSNQPKKVWNGEDHKSWGNSISFFNWNTRQLVGHTTPHPSVGDELLMLMQSGKTARFKFVTVKPCVDPSDMWFATVKDMYYEEAK